ncbi:MAG: ribbon-helix-helix domain-containing protein [Pseudonocardiaceae bacterium]
MRTTVTLDDDVAAAVEALRRKSGIGVSQAIGQLIRAGLVTPAKGKVYRHRTSDLGLRMEVSNIGEVLDRLDEG